MAIFVGTQDPVNNDTKAQTMAIPALGPSFFCAPEGRCKCTSGPCPPFVSKSLSILWLSFFLPSPLVCPLLTKTLSGSPILFSTNPNPQACLFTQLNANSPLSYIPHLPWPMTMGANLNHGRMKWRGQKYLMRNEEDRGWFPDQRGGQLNCIARLLTMLTMIPILLTKEHTQLSHRSHISLPIRPTPQLWTSQQPQ